MSKEKSTNGLSKFKELVRSREFYLNVFGILIVSAVLVPCLIYALEAVFIVFPSSIGGHCEAKEFSGVTEFYWMFPTVPLFVTMIYIESECSLIGFSGIGLAGKIFSSILALLALALWVVRAYESYYCISVF